MRGGLAKLKMDELLTRSKGNPIVKSLCEYIYDQHVIELLQDGGCFTCRKLVHGVKRIKADETILTIQPSTKRKADRILNSQRANQLYIPKRKDHKSIDAWIPGVGAFKMVSNEDYEMEDVNIEEDLSKLGEGANKLYWLLPRFTFDSFTKKSLHRIDQYAVYIPNPYLQR
jgi:hypothetical protein